MNLLSLAQLRQEATEMTEIRKAEPPQDVSEYKGVMVYLDSFNNSLTRAALEMVGAGRRMADKTSEKLICAVIGKDTKGMADEAGLHGCDEIYGFNSEDLSMYRSKPYSDILADLVYEKKPNILIVPGSKNGRDLAARVAVKVRSGLTADCMDLDVEPDTKILLARRPDYGDSTMSEIRCEKHRPQMATSRPGTFATPDPDPKRKFQVSVKDVKLQKNQLNENIISFNQKNEEDITGSKVIVSGGLGMGKQEGLDLIRKLAEQLGGSVGVSRPIADLGWISREHQVGQTGETVRPNLYIAAGISGQPQHIVGMMDSKVVVSINTDPDAEMNKFADYIIVGDLYEVIPKLMDSIKKATGAKAKVASQ